MRRKIAKRKRREVLSRAKITAEYWERGDGWKCFVVEAECNGWTIFAPDDDELSAYKATLECIDVCEEAPPEKKEGTDQ